MKTIFLKPKDIQPTWYLIDAKGKTLGRLATQVAAILRGKHKPYYVPHQAVGDYVIIVNADKIVVSGNKETKKLYYRHTGYPGGLKVATFSQVMEKHPTYPLEKAIKGMLPKNRLGRALFRRVKIYAGETHPHAAQKPVVLS
ncbi:50S ribosomal protein L13 [Spirochaeta thermophila]|uniref:Large ribosomal subunit protein uL13 n=2 Tax=Winmispira thermophila TaxID=154 RepID=G0GFL8_WINT7|nr:50S ribosomal protein L13 [Spirochaeta thermophila]ADN03048.1 50S ribosomal protein L13 [Spirochaeta thermophila DSM 6192]AEJ62417.1 ribosomal protein L13 [Spirochaeta thermophila DSM 6578]